MPGGTAGGPASALFADPRSFQPRFLIQRSCRRRHHLALRFPDENEKTCASLRSHLFLQSHPFSGPERQRRLSRVAHRVRGELRSRGFSVLDGITPIVPVVIGDEVDLCRLCKSLLEEGIYMNPVLRPAAAHNLLRISCTAAHTDAQVDRLVATLVRVATRLGVGR